MCCFHSFFFESAVRHPAVCCSLHLIGRQRSRARERIENPAKAKTVTVAKGQKGDAGAVFDLAPKVGSVSDKRAANGGVTAWVKKAQTNNVNEAGNGEWKMGARGRDGLTSARRVRRWPSPGWGRGRR